MLNEGDSAGAALGVQIACAQEHRNRDREELAAAIHIQRSSVLRRDR
jgi:hypothetical protein